MSRESRLACGVIGSTLLLRTAVAATLGLSDDEAWYWALSETPRLSYTVHPPLSIWLVHLTTRILGHSPIGVRLSSLLCSTIGSFYLIRLAEKMGLYEGTLITAVLCTITPLLFLGGILSGPDLPLFMFWAAAMDASYEVWRDKDGNSMAWIRLGLFTGLAMISKYNALLIGPIVALSLASTKEGRKALGTPWPYLAALIALSLFSPVLIWNAKHEWDSFRFQFFSRHGDGNHININRWISFCASQFFLYGPLLVYGWLSLMRTALKRERSEAEHFLAPWALVPGAVFFIQPLCSEFKIHWALCAYIPILVYLAQKPLSKGHRLALAFSGTFTLLGMSCIYTPLLSSVLASSERDITNDFHGWDEFKGHYSALPAPMRALPIVATRYQTAAQAAFALGARANVLIIPHDSYELRDWGGPDQAPSRFLYINDHRYHDQVESQFPSHECQMAGEFRSYRRSHATRTISLHFCRSKIKIN